MPLPKPKKNEEEDKFIARCMSEAKDEFPDQKQRLAVCYSQWRKPKEKKEMSDARRAIPYKDYGLADENTPWNGPKEVAAAEVEDLKKICTWVDPENDDTKQGYKLPHHRVSDNKAVWRAVRAAMGALLGARGGVQIPSADRRGVYNHLAKHYKAFDKDVPSFRSRIGDIERRYLTYPFTELRVDEDENVIEGYGARFNVWSSKLGFFKERIKAGAFKHTLENKDDVRSLYNHDANYILARTKNKTLRLWEDDKGLAFEAKLPETSYAKDLMINIKRKNITQNSFGFEAVRDEWNEKGDKRELVEVKLYDVGPVTFPAYPQTSIQARSVLYDIGIDYDALCRLIIRQSRGIELTDSDNDLLESIVDTLQSFIPEEGRSEDVHPEETAPDTSEEPEEPSTPVDYTTLMAATKAMREVEEIIGDKSNDET